MINEFDVIVIGSGAGGAPIVNELVKRQRQVLLLEKGPLMRCQYQTPDQLSDFKRDEMFATGPEHILDLDGMKNNGAAYFTSHIEPDLNDEPHVYRDRDGQDYATIEGYTAQVVGGGTQLYGGVSLRFTDRDFKLASFNSERNDLRADPINDVRREARDWPISYTDLEPYYSKAEKLIGINGTLDQQHKHFCSDTYQKPLDPNPISLYVQLGMDALGFGRYRTPLAVITADHPESGRKVSGDPRTAYVNRYGDPLGLKSNTWVSLLAPLIGRENFLIKPNSVVTHLESSRHEVNKVHYLDESGQCRVAKAKFVVVACSAIESVRLLMLSAMYDTNFSSQINFNQLLGKYFLTHSFGGADGLLPRRHDKSISLDSDWATDACLTDDFLRHNGLWAGGVIYNNTSDSALPISLARTHGHQDLDNIWKAFVQDESIIGDELIRFLDEEFGTRVSITFMANQVPIKSNRIELHSSITDKWKRPVAYVVKQWHSHDIALMDTYADVCARILYEGGVRDIGKGGVYQAPNANARMANHIMGGARFGLNESDSVLDKYCRAWRFDNLYVTDGSFMPTSGSANPTLTIQANAFRVAEHLGDRLNGPSV